MLSKDLAQVGSVPESETRHLTKMAGEWAGRWDRGLLYLMTSALSEVDGVLGAAATAFTTNTGVSIAVSNAFLEP